MQFTAEKIQQLLKNYHILKGKVESGLATSDICQSVELLEKSVSVLPEIDYQIITLVFMEKQSYAKVARKVGYTKPGVQTRIKIICKNLGEIMNP